MHLAAIITFVACFALLADPFSCSGFGTWGVWKLGLRVVRNSGEGQRVQDLEASGLRLLGLDFGVRALSSAGGGRLGRLALLSWTHINTS